MRIPCTDYFKSVFNFFFKIHKIRIRDGTQPRNRFNFSLEFNLYKEALCHIRLYVIYTKLKCGYSGGYGT